MASLGKLLRQIRTRLGITLPELSERTGLAPETLRGYERGLRVPDRERLLRVLNALELPRLDANAILESAGLAAVRDLKIPADSATWSGLSQTQKLVDQCAWPAFAVNDLIQVIAANRPFERLFGVDLAREFPDPSSRSLLALATTPRFADRFENWDEAAGILIAVWKGHFTRPVSLDEPTPHLSKVLEGVAAGDPTYLRRILDLWNEVELIPPVRRWFYRVLWRDDEFGLLNFQCVVQTGDDPETMISFNDWVPLDSKTYAALEAMRSR